MTKRAFRINPPSKPAYQHVPAYQRVPIEVWEHIFKHLYPSQLSRISMLNKYFSSIISSLEVWSQMLVIAYGPKANLRALVGVPRSKCCMMFMCSSSLHVCERCFGRTGYNADSMVKLPLSIPVLLPKRSTDTLKNLGGKFDPNFTIRMCLSCRQDHLSTYEEPLPRSAENSKVTGIEMRQRYPCWRAAPGLGGLAYGGIVIDEAVVIDGLRRSLGGDIGIGAYR